LADPSLHAFAAGDGYVWNYRRLNAASASRAEVIVLHGIQSHGGWYLNTGHKLAQGGFNVSLLDRRGCGVNEKNRGDAPSFRRLLDDIAEYASTLPEPRVLIGISWGGKLAVALQRRHPTLTDALILIAPGFCPLVRHSLGERLQIFASRFVAPKREFRIPLNDPELFTANPVRREYIRNDPLALRSATARMFFESARMDVYLRLARLNVYVPTLLLLAEHDRIIDNERTRAFCKRWEPEVIEFPGAHHTLEFEPKGAPYVADLQNWLSQNL